MEETNETLKLKHKKKNKSEKGNLKEKEVYRCHHDTRYEKTRDASIVYEKNHSRDLEIHSVHFK